MNQRFPRGAAAIVGLGVTPMGKIYGRSAADFAGEAIASALSDAGLTPHDVDGLLVNTNNAPDMTALLQLSLGLEDLTIVNGMGAYGSTVGTMLQYAAFAIEAGLANTIVLVYADAPLAEGGRAGASYVRPRPVTGVDSLRAVYGNIGANPGYAMAARLHMDRFGTTSEQLGAIAVAQRRWATMNPAAQMRTPITIEDHQTSRFIAEPLRLLDCCLVSNGAVAVVVTAADRARDLRQPPVPILAAAQAAPGDTGSTDAEPYLYTGARVSGRAALAMAEITLDDVQLLELYDCYTYTVLVTLEDYGFCAKGEGGSFVQDGRLGPGGTLPTNTGGGQLSGYYMWGMTPLAEAVIQLRGQAGERQVADHDVALVSGNGGLLGFHATIVLGSAAAA